MLFSTYLRFVILFTITIFKPSVSLNLSIVQFTEAFTSLYNNQNVVPSIDGKSVEISMNQWTTSGSGFISRNAYYYGLFTASIKLPNNRYSAGVVATFYAQSHELNRDEIDFEFLGHIESEKWVLQTNIYGNGSVNKGREERYTLPFDPSEDCHNYTILWNTGRIVFYVDDCPIREVENVESMGGDFPSQPMFLYGTIWDGSDWATQNGKYRVDFQHGSFVTSYSSFVINGCRVDQVESTPMECDIALPSGISDIERSKMNVFRSKYMTYSYCHDTARYRATLPECGVEGPGMQPVEAPISGASSRFI